MRNVLLVLTFFLVFAAYSESYAASTRGYTKKNGTSVQPYQRTAPDKSKHNNYSTKGNTNPYTGKKGTTDPYKTGAPMGGR